MTTLQSRLEAIRAEIPEGVRLVAVSKFHPAPLIREAYDCGQRDFGESRAQELLLKKELLPQDVRWHFIGHLQKNKVKAIVPFVYLIHSVDSYALLKEIDRQAQKIDRKIDVLLELHVAQESSKSGFAPDELLQVFEQGEWRKLQGVRIKGLMCMATNTDDKLRISSDFAKALSVFNEVKGEYFENDDAFEIKSWGMSGDWKEAVEEGSDMVRIGTAIFGEREY